MSASETGTPVGEGAVSSWHCTFSPAVGGTRREATARHPDATVQFVHAAVNASYVDRYRLLSTPVGFGLASLQQRTTQPVTDVLKAAEIATNAGQSYNPTG